jgi:MOSC domain-containing protein YiiM
VPKIVAIYLRPTRGEVPVEVDGAQVIPGFGLEGDHFSKAGGHRQVTLLSLAAWKQVCQELETNLSVSTRRANLIIDDIDFKESKGKFIKIAADTSTPDGVLLHIRGETTPCSIMDETHQGLKDALKPDWRGGVYASVASGGFIRVGDEVSLSDC